MTEIRDEKPIPIDGSDEPTLRGAEPTPSSRPWLVAWLIVIAYTAAYGWQISQYTALPYWDQSGYVNKIYTISTQLQDPARTWRRPWSLLNPLPYLAAEPALRPPLLVLPAVFLWGNHTTPQQFAWTLLIERMLLLMLGAWVLARVLRDVRWVPAALALTLSSNFFLHLNQALYLMDLPFASMALLSVALVARAMQQRTAGACLLACLGVLALLLIKPQALAYMFPFMAILVIERLFHEIGTLREKPRRIGLARQIFSLLLWLIILAGLLAAIGCLLLSPYGFAAKTQYSLNEHGYWQNMLTWQLGKAIFIGLLPPWLLISTVIMLIWIVLNRISNAGDSITPPAMHDRIPSGGWIFVLIFFCTCFWIYFNCFLVYEFDPHLIWAIMPLVIAGLTFAIWRIRWFGIGVTLVSLLIFAASVGISAPGVPADSWVSPYELLGPRIIRQFTVPEVGLTKFVDDVSSEVQPPQPAPSPLQRPVVTVTICDTFVEYGAMSVAQHLLDPDHPPRLEFRQAPFGDDGFDLEQLFDPERTPWFVASDPGTRSHAPTRAVVNMGAITTLIAAPLSPLHDLFERRVTAQMHMPRVPETGIASLGYDDKIQPINLTLWRLKRKPTRDELLRSVDFIASQFTATPGAVLMNEQRTHLAQFLKLGTGVNIIDVAALPAAKNIIAKDVQFAQGLRLRTLAANWLQDGSLQVEMVWQADTDQTLLNNRFFHLLDIHGNIVGQADAPQDSLRGSVKAGTRWLDTVLIPSTHMNSAVKIGIGFQLPSGQSLEITPRDGLLLDWQNHRLLAPLPPR